MKWLLIIGAVGLGAAPLATSAAAEQPVGSSELDAGTMQALDHMGEALRSRTDINVHTDLTVEDVTMSGQKLQYGGSVDILARRPNRLRMDMRIANGTRQLFYDGAKLTFYSPNLGTYAVAQAPGTIRGALLAAREQYGLEIPLADLFMWGDDRTVAQDIRSAFRVGAEVIGDQLCDHFAIRQDHADWQIWIRQGSEPLPCKLVITNRVDPAMPQVSAVYRWLPATPVADATFKFAAPDGALPIIFGPMKAPSSSAGN
jgi:hypothetical protein